MFVLLLPIVLPIVLPIELPINRLGGRYVMKSANICFRSPKCHLSGVVYGVPGVMHGVGITLVSTSSESTS